MGFEPMMRVLQTLALPLGDVARLKPFTLKPSYLPFTGKVWSDGQSKLI